MKQKIKGIAGIAIMFLALAATYFWLTHGQVQLESVTLLVAQKDIPRGTVIDNANNYFKPERINMSSAVTGAIKPENIDQLNGRIAEQFIPANGQIVTQTFSGNSVVLKENEFVFKLPPTWVYSIPSSIRRGDKISIYEIDGNIDGKLDNSEDQDIKLVKGKTESIFNTTVVFVKDSTNREVTDTNGKERLDGSSQVSAIEIICTRSDTQILESSVLNGKKLIVVYR
ncbi:SAF domain-containing protein [Ruminiclostridium cellobioparum]|uniref:SAF domain-containing protein n=1 Tax=Ruminiclostridium cellobioparum subsp. termitidis CT1112 TaxID=1195236 RepID=S0FJE1_RUMCE|nr:SAF domain-containing protein [Ruminiclostridium cellobioparum]EMS72255.1 hypothetical protein CTER_1746 [Ruminiclostridium cellobioparum subsp. termitidis CT1112]